MKTSSSKNRDFRLPLALGASVGIGHGILRATTENLGPLWGFFVYVASVPVLALGFFLIFGSQVKTKDTPSGH